MAVNEDTAIKAGIDCIRHLAGERQGASDYFKAASLAQSVIHDTIGGSHPIMAALKYALESGDWPRAGAASRAVIAPYDGALSKAPV